MSLTRVAAMCSLFAAVVISLVPSVRAENWPAWRGPTGQGVIIGDHAFVVNEPSVVCIDLKTGKQLWEEKIGKAWGSIVQANGKLYLTCENTETRIFAPNTKEYEEIARNKLDGAITRASIVPSDGELFIRTHTHLWCIATKK